MRTVDEVRRLNDLARQSLLGRISLSERVSQSTRINEIMERVVGFNEFTEANNPYGEHDFGAFDLDGVKYFWKIDYYAPGFEFGADPYQDERVARVLTIMEASEY